MATVNCWILHKYLLVISLHCSHTCVFYIIWLSGIAKRHELWCTAGDIILVKRSIVIITFTTIIAIIRTNIITSSSSIVFVIIIIGCVFIISSSTGSMDVMHS